MERSTSSSDDSERDTSSTPPVERRPQLPDSGLFFIRRPEAHAAPPLHELFGKKKKNDEEISDDTDEATPSQPVETEEPQPEAPSNRTNVAELLRETLQQIDAEHPAPDPNAVQPLATALPIAPQPMAETPADPNLTPHRFEPYLQPPTPNQTFEHSYFAPAETPPDLPAGGTGKPPTPPRPPINSSPQFSPYEQPRDRFDNDQQTHNAYLTGGSFGNANIGYNSAPNVAADTHNDDVYRAEKYGLRRGLIAGALTAWLIHSYIVGKRQQRERAKHTKEINTFNERVTNLEYAQDQQTKTHNAASERFAVTQQATAEQLKQTEKKAALAAEQAAQTIEQLQQEHSPDERVVQSAWHNIVVDRFGHEKQDANTYGEAFQDERSRERMPTPFGSQDMRFRHGLGMSQSAQNDAGQSSSTGQPTVSSDHLLPQPPMQTDLQHRLPEPQNPFIALLTSPWLWLAVGIILVVFFLSASL